MAENIQGEVCGGSWAWPWNPSRGLSCSSSCCSQGINDMGGFAWLSHELLDSNTKSTDESGSASDGSIVIQPDSSIDSSLEIMGIGLSSSITADWNRALVHGDESCEALNPPALQREDPNSTMNYQQETGVGCPQGMQKNWNLKNFSTLVEDSSINALQLFNQDHLKPSISPSSTPQCSSTCQSLPPNFPISSVPYGYSPSLQTIFETEPQTQQSFYDSNHMNACRSTTNYQANFNQFPNNSLTECSSSLPNQKPPKLPQLSAKRSSCNTSAVALNEFPVGPFPSGPQFFSPAQNHGKRPSLANVKATINKDEVQGLSSVSKKSSCEPRFKRPRLETPAPLPTFKVRKEKLGDRVTALQQLVSPFGKTDTASVLQEAIEYIKFLHDQVSVFSSPYLKNGAPSQRLQNCDTANEQGPNQDLKSQGLCLVPISSTFPVAAESTTDFWIPAFGGTLRIPMSSTSNKSCCSLSRIYVSESYA